ncbi:MAG: PspC domain-containing protein [Pseudonocardiaceae bacterium]
MNVENTIRDFWATRPHRRVDDRKIGGVAAAIGRRYAIDPVLVRVAFVVATLFSGVGVLLYLLGWLLLPAEGDAASAAEGLLGRGRSSASPVLTMVLGLALIPAASVVFGGNAYGLIGLAVTGAAIVLLHHSRAALGEIPAAADPATAPVTADPATADPAVQGTAGPGAVPGPGGNRPTPPAWDPLSTAPFAWDLPEPTPVPPQAPPQPRKPRSTVTPITLGLALLVGGVASAFWPALPLAHIVALMLGVVGLGLVVGSLVRGGRGLIVVAVPLALLTWVLHAVPVSGFDVGEGRWSPVNPVQVQPHYDLTMGNGRLDLTGLRVPDGQTLSTAVAVGLGEARVTLPRDIDAQVRCRAPIGAVDCLGVTSSGIPARVDEQNNGPDGPGGGTVILDVYAGVGNVAVVRGS